ncbi:MULTISPECIES: DUF1120 domain-containing protein [Stenotrophomonas]|uniref:DUF1120 domain-containing protein n=1 Tax=Stenotrophomonas maltophilia TaxID=40324 RepID=A0A2W6I612_STEMA|nr:MULTISPECIES: DUF1120 domain-containing protein [Stenotrophomonas]PZS91180.1 hypothetical protein A7X83_09245 [Stenotrophomonas maltophilia]
MSKVQLSLATTVLALLSAGAVHAGPIAPSTLKVTGSLDVPACLVTAGDDGVYDYGSLGPGDIRTGTTYNVLPAISKAWKIECEGDTYLTFKVTDNAAASASAVGSSYFGMGNVNGTGKLGYYTVTMRNPKVNGTASNVFATSTTAITRATTAAVQQSSYTMGWAQTAANLQQIGRVFETDLDVVANLAGSQTMGGPITEDAKLEGSLTLNFAYGL